MILYRCKYWSSQGGKCRDGDSRRIIKGKKLEECLVKGCRKLQSFVPRERNDRINRDVGVSTIKT